VLGGVSLREEKEDAVREHFKETGKEKLLCSFLPARGKTTVFCGSMLVGKKGEGTKAM